MGDKLKTIWKEAVVAYLNYYPGICREGLIKIIKAIVRIVGIQRKIRTQYLPDIGLKQYF
jgi:hypothetical protein